MTPNELIQLIESEEATLDDVWVFLDELDCISGYSQSPKGFVPSGISVIIESDYFSDDEEARIMIPFDFSKNSVSEQDDAVREALIAFASKMAKIR